MTAVSSGTFARAIFGPAENSLRADGIRRILRSQVSSNSRILHRQICSAQAEEIPYAAALVIGNEILTGKIQDTNTSALGEPP